MFKKIVQRSLALFSVFQVVFSLQAQDKQTLSFLFVGDVMQHGGQIEAAYNKANDSYDYKDCFKFVKPIIQQADISIANLEVTHAGKPYKGYPQFSAPPQLSEGIVDAGFNVILTANNHSCDGGAKGIKGTLDVLDKLGVKHTGTFRNKKERDENYPLLVEKNGFRVAVLNYTFSTNGLSVAKPLIVNYIDSGVMQKDFAKAKQMQVDFIVCALHWGAEYQPLPNDYQKKWEKYCYELGADMVIGSHPHVLEPIQQKQVGGRECLTVWSLGNFISNQRDRYKNGGVMLRTFAEKQNGKAVLTHSDYILTYVYPRKEGITKPYYLLPDFDYNSLQPGFVDENNLKLMHEFYADSRELFAKYNSKTTETKVNSNTAWTQLYANYVKGYYAVQIEEQQFPKFQLKPDSLIKSDFRQFTRSDGKYVLLYGMYDTKEKAFGEQQFLKDVGVNSMRVVWVNPKELTLTEQSK